MKKYTKRRKTKRNRPFHNRKTVRGGDTSPNPAVLRNKFTEYYDNDAVYLFNEDIDIFGDPFEKSPIPESGRPIYGKYTMEEWLQKPRSDREKRLADANAKKDPKRVRGRIESVVEYVNKKNREASRAYPFVLFIPAFEYTTATGTQIIEEETVPDSSKGKNTDPILPDDFLRFTRRSDILNILFPFFMKVYVSLQKEINEGVGETNKEEKEEDVKRMDYVLFVLREIHSFASPIWFSPIYHTFYKMGFAEYFKQASMTYENFIKKLNEALAKTKETPVETTMYSFPSFADCRDAKCEPNNLRPIHSVFIQNSEFDDKAPIDSYLNMIFYGRDSKTTALSALKSQIKKDPLMGVAELT